MKKITINSNTNNDQSYNEQRSEEEQQSDEDISIHNNIGSPYSIASSANILKRNSTSGDWSVLTEMNPNETSTGILPYQFGSSVDM